MKKPTIRELVQQYKPTNAEEFADTVLRHRPEYGNMGAILIDMVRKEIHQQKSIGGVKPHNE